jgi:CdiI N-terminal domain
MPFSIAFLDEPLVYPYDDVNTPGASGLLTMGNLKERFCSSLYHWSKRDYESQWRHAINVLLNESFKAALIVEYTGTDASSHLEWWPMYKVGDAVYLQNQLLFYNQLPEPFSLDRPFIYLRNRETTDQAGRPISEWLVRLSEVEQFAANAAGRTSL